MSRAQVNPPCDEDPDEAAPAIDFATATDEGSSREVIPWCARIQEVCQEGIPEYLGRIRVLYY